jgi:hypothetical protein
MTIFLDVRPRHISYLLLEIKKIRERSIRILPQIGPGSLAFRGITRKAFPRRRECKNGTLLVKNWIPAFAGMTKRGGKPFLE